MLKLVKHKKYDENYFEFGFIENKDGRPKCITGLQVLANEDMKPAKLRRHLITKHPDSKENHKDLFQWKYKEYMRQKTQMVNLATVSEKDRGRLIW